MQGNIVMVKSVCVGCGKLVDVSDLMHREMMLRCRNRVATRADCKPDINVVYMAHPAVEGCHKGCDKSDPPQQWVRYQRCKLPGCCQPVEEVEG